MDTYQSDHTGEGDQGILGCGDQGAEQEQVRAQICTMNRSEDTEARAAEPLWVPVPKQREEKRSLGVVEESEGLGGADGMDYSRVRGVWDLIAQVHHRPGQIGVLQIERKTPIEAAGSVEGAATVKHVACLVSTWLR
jgi:hypothetical protein